MEHILSDINLSLSNSVGHVHSVRVLQMRHCAFVNFTTKEDCEKAINYLHVSVCSVALFSGM